MARGMATRNRCWRQVLTLCPSCCTLSPVTARVMSCTLSANTFGKIMTDSARSSQITARAGLALTRMQPAQPGASCALGASAPADD
jgi:hypothetical protein